MRKIAALLLALILLLAACSSQEEKESSSPRENVITSEPDDVYIDPEEWLSPQQEKTDPPATQTDTIGVTVYVTDHGKKYHSAGCQYLARSCNSIDLGDAISKGYGPCSKCDPPD